MIPQDCLCLCFVLPELIRHMNENEWKDMLREAKATQVGRNLDIVNRRANAAVGVSEDDRMKLVKYLQVKTSTLFHSHLSIILRLQALIINKLSM